MSFDPNRTVLMAGSSIFFVLGVIGLALNLGVAYVLIQSRKKINHTSFLYIHVMICDTIMAINNVVGQIIHLLGIKWSFEGCQANGFASFLSEAMVVSLVFLQVLHPFIVVVLQKPAASVRQLSIAVTIIWILALINSAIPFFSKDYYTLGPSETWCFLSPSTQSRGSRALIFGTIAALLFFIAFMIIACIMMTVRLRDILSTIRAKESPRMAQLAWLMLKRSMIMSFLFLICWTFPIYVLIGEYSSGETSPCVITDIAFPCCIILANISNPLVLIFTDDGIYKVLISSLTRMNLHPSEFGECMPDASQIGSANAPFVSNHQHAQRTSKAAGIDVANRSGVDVAQGSMIQSGCARAVRFIPDSTCGVTSSRVVVMSSGHLDLKSNIPKGNTS